MNKSSVKELLSRPRIARAAVMAGALLTIGLAQFARAGDITYTYTGNPFAYNPEGPPDATNVSGSFTLTSPIPPDTTLTIFFPRGATTASGGYANSPVMTGYYFTDGQEIWTPANNENPNNESQFVLITDANSDIVFWSIFVDSPDGNLGTSSNAPCCSNAVDGSSEFPGGNPYVYGFVSIYGDPGTWTESSAAGVPEPTTIGMTVLGGAILFLARRRKQQNHKATQTDRTPPAHA